MKSLLESRSSLAELYSQVNVLHLPAGNRAKKTSFYLLPSNYREQWLGLESVCYCLVDLTFFGQASENEAGSFDSQ